MTASALGRTTREPALGDGPAPVGLLQRKCSCGGAASLQGECEECQKKRLHRRGGGAAAAIAPPVVNEVLRSPGQLLDAGARAFMEPRFGHDFGGVRVHIDARAAESARNVNALAYTVGRDIVFGSGQYAPDSESGRKLLAHELHHVSHDAGDARPDSPIEIAGADAPGEAEARAAEAMGAEAAALAPAPLAPGRLRRKEQPAQSAGASQPQHANAALISPCLQPIAGEEIEILLESRAVTIVEYGAEWCHPCKDLQADLTAICQRFRTNPPPVPVRFYTVDVDEPSNATTVKKEAAGDVPQLVIYVGSTERYHIVGRPDPEVLEQRINEQIEYASRSGAARGAWSGLKWGAGLGAAAGLALGVGLAFAGVLSGGTVLAALAGLTAGGAVAGGGLGAGLGAIIGALTDRRERAVSARVGFNEAESLIRRRYGKYLSAGAGPLHGARFRPVTQAELQMWFKCRHPESANQDMGNLVGWTDTGPEPPRVIASAADEPTCAGGQLEHATLDRPVIYYAVDRRDLTVLIHEGLHAHAHPKFAQQLRNFINEGTAEYFTRKLANEIGATSESGYGDNVQQVMKLVAVIGEDALAAAYFEGDFTAANRVLGACGLERWAQLLQAMYGQSQEADGVLKSRGGNYCAAIKAFPGVPRDEQ
ncbi:thiol-disulfide isomerase/thioredoxin [Bradyrhizobium sp. USDA 3397]